MVQLPSPSYNSKLVPFDAPKPVLELHSQDSQLLLHSKTG